MTYDQIDRMVRQANPVPDLTVFESVDTSALRFDQQRRTEMQTHGRVSVDQEPDKPRRGPLIGVAAIAAAAIGALILFQTAEAPPLGDEAMTPVETATAFVEAYGAFEVDEAVSYLSADALQSNFGGLEGFRLDSRWREATGFKVMLETCEELTSSTSGTRVRCTYDYHAIRSDEIGFGPYGGSWFDISVQDGEIVGMSDNIVYEQNGYSAEVWEPFAEWVSQTYTDDVLVLYTDQSQTLQRITEDSIPLWEQRSREYVRRVRAPDGSSAPGIRLSRTVEGVPFSFTVPASGWEPNIPDLLIAKDVRGSQGAEAILFWTGFPESTHADACIALDIWPAPSSAADLATTVANLSGIDLLSGPTDVTIGGRPAKHLAFIVKEDIGCDPGFLYTWRASTGGALWVRSELEDTINLWITAVDGKVLVFAGETHADAGDAVAEEIQQIIASISFD